MKFTKKVTETKELELRVFPRITERIGLGMQTYAGIEIGAPATDEDLKAAGYVRKADVLECTKRFANRSGVSLEQGSPKMLIAACQALLTELEAL